MYQYHNVMSGALSTCVSVLERIGFLLRKEAGKKLAVMF